MTQMNEVDVRRFEFDFDTTWSAFLVDADLNIYSRYGGRDENVADSRMSKASLLHTMQAVLDVHRQRADLKPEELKASQHPAPGERATPEDIPLLKNNHEGCVHCHQVREYAALQAAHDGLFKRRMLFGYPLPENLGIKLERDHGHRVGRVFESSPAAAADLRAGDVIERVNDVPVRSEADIRWALHRLPDREPLVIAVERPRAGLPPEQVQVKLQPEGAWRHTELGWRKSLRSVPFPIGFIAYGLGREERRAAGLPADTLAIKVLSVRGAGLGENVQLRKGDLIVNLAGRTGSRTFEEFKSDLLRLYEPENKVQLTVVRAGVKVELSGKFPAWHTTETSVP